MGIPPPLNISVMLLPAAALPVSAVSSCVLVVKCRSMVVIMDAIPMTMPAMVGARKCICDFMSPMVSAMRSRSRSLTACIFLM